MMLGAEAFIFVNAAAAASTVPIAEQRKHQPLQISWWRVHLGLSLWVSFTERSRKSSEEHEKFGKFSAASLVATDSCSSECISSPE